VGTGAGDGAGGHLLSAAAELLRGRGFDALTVIEQWMGGFKDPALWSAVQM
jgi:acetyl esterase/lipase